jgi:hypothetical protein
MRRITSSDLPQADRLESVLLTVIAVANGATSDIEIANSIPVIEGDDRQGRYYRNAAEMLGFIVNSRNQSKLTEKGIMLLLNPVITNPVLISSVLNLQIYQKLLPYLELYPNGRTRQQIQLYLESIADPRIGPSMIPRRMGTILSWPRTLGFIKLDDTGLFKVKNNLSNEVPIFEITDDSQPILPVTGELSEYQTIEQRTIGAKGTVTYWKDQAKLERSANAHIALVNLVAKRIREYGGIPKSNQLIDLAVNLDKDYLFEMKSINNSNTKTQVRKGLSQLYEYRYLQNIPSAKLVLVIEKSLGNDHSWIIDFMENDRDINVIWDGNDELYGTEKTRRELSFLNLLS